MTKRKRSFSFFTAMLLCFGLFSPISALAQEPEESGIIDGEALKEQIESYIEEKDLNGENISVGYCYTPTGDNWYYNGDKWYYSASMYKVPLMMIFAEKEYEGELSQDSNLKGLTLAQAEEYILTYSNNDYAHLMMSVLGTDRECRELYQQYSDLPVEDYDPDFYDYSYFTARFMTDVMETLYFEQERFPHIIDCLKLAQPENYFNRYLGASYDIAQKYGSYKEFNSTSGIVYTPEPFILTVMTEDLSIAMGETVIADFAKLFADYTLSLDAELERYEQEKAAEEQRRKEEEEQRLKEEEQLRLEEEQRQKEEEEALERQEEERLLQLEKQQRREKLIKLALAGCGVLAAGGLLAFLIVSGKKRRRAPARAGKNTGSGRKGSGGYKPRH